MSAARKPKKSAKTPSITNSPHAPNANDGEVARTPAQAVHRGLQYLHTQQDARGALMGDYDGPLFLLPGYVFARYAIGRPLIGEEAAPLVATLRATQNHNGSFGLHYDGEGYVFTTTLSYVAMRLLGVPADDSDAQKAREFILDKGGAIMSPAWGKFWLATLGLCDWQGVHPVVPELWLLPRTLPVHPNNWWCHARAVYLPVAYLYARRYQVPATELLQSIRQEIYTSQNIDWVEARDFCAPTDRYVDGSLLLAAMNKVLAASERLIPQTLREHAMDAVLEQIRMGEENTDYLDIGPVSKAFNVVALFDASNTGRASQELFLQAAAGMERYIRDQERGRSMLAYCGSETWDTLYGALAAADSGQATAHVPFVEAAYRFIDQQQMLIDPLHGRAAGRDPTQGTWGFAQNGWPVVDCTSLGLLAAIKLRGVVKQPIAEPRLVLAVERLLDMQNADGGFGTYEKARVSPLLEWINPSEIFSDIMLEHSQTELTSSAICALTFAQRHLLLSTFLNAAVSRAVKRAAKMLLQLQREDGSFEGNWGICFTYGTYFGVAGLAAAKPRHAHERIALASRYLQHLQNPDGGFGESHLACLERYYVPHPQGSQAPMTAWAALALAEDPSQSAIRAHQRALDWLVKQQLPNGDWPKTALTGVFNKTCMLNYPFYRNYFPLLALAPTSKRLG